MITENFYKELEKDFSVTYPESKNATYTSLLNYSDEGKKPRQRWYRYKEGFSIDLVKRLIKDYNKNENGSILDPFLGSGSTIIGANELGLKGIGYEVNPFSYFLSQCKLYNYSQKDAAQFEKDFLNIVDRAEKLSEKKGRDVQLPNLSIADKVFNINIAPFVMSVKCLIDKYDGKAPIKNLLLLGWLSSIEEMSQYRKAGNGLKRKTKSKNTVNNIFLARTILLNNYDLIYRDIISDEMKYNAKIYNKSSLLLDKDIKKESISGVIYSPPYANAFDYTEIYKLELWFGGFVQEYSDLKKLRDSSIRSHLNGLTLKDAEKEYDFKSLTELELLLEEVETKKLWNKKIPLMLKFYFSEMFEILEKLYRVLEMNGFCSIIVGNSAYGGVIIPTDLLFAKYAEKLGFKVDIIEVDRYIITSSQQYKETEESKKFLRESIICLVKK